jgi:hypothetical protein
MLSIENKTLQANEEALIARDSSRCEEHNAGQSSQWPCALARERAPYDVSAVGMRVFL